MHSHTNCYRVMVSWSWNQAPIRSTPPLHPSVLSNPAPRVCVPMLPMCPVSGLGQPWDRPLDDCPRWRASLGGSDCEKGWAFVIQRWIRDGWPRPARPPLLQHDGRQRCNFWSLTLQNNNKFPFAAYDPKQLGEIGFAPDDTVE